MIATILALCLSSCASLTADPRPGAIALGLTAPPKAEGQPALRLRGGGAVGGLVVGTTAAIGAVTSVSMYCFSAALSAAAASRRHGCL